MAKKGNAVFPVAIVGLLIVAVLGIGYLAYGGLPGAGTIGTLDEETGTLKIDDNTGDPATVVFNSYDRVANSPTEVYPHLLVYVRGEGNEVLDPIVNCAGSNSTTSVVVGDFIDVYGCGEDDEWYVDEKLGIEILDTRQTVTLDTYNQATLTNLKLTAFNRSGQALGDGLNGSSEADYTIGLGADASALLRFELELAEADCLYDMSAICTFHANDIDDFIITSVDTSNVDVYSPVGVTWTEVDVPKELDDTTVAITNESFNDQTASFKHCYQASSPIRMAENEYVTIKATVDSDSTGTDVNTGDVFGFIVLDSSWNKNLLNEPTYGFFQSDVDEKVTDMGAAESALTDVFGKTYKVAIDAT